MKVNLNSIKTVRFSLIVHALAVALIFLTISGCSDNNSNDGRIKTVVGR